MTTLTVKPRTGHKSLLYSELVTELDGLVADIAVLGMPFGSPYSPRSYTNDQTNAPQVIRDVTDRIVRAPEHYDFDIEGPLLQGFALLISGTFCPISMSLTHTTKRLR